ncbi:hypothetical protein CDO52_11245 [Nocardiopsis gilva YIM 90087]|uniref:Uncharacterized protein n=1 Tax=Nocardiopsis gilva YIM 90087 TaxID=1235441 RepID=A0A223S575_9ACTN|nr:hypothetical protein [Nocardiopsis gilva]ASU83275.1 hypothetical protein CDO52_11245 [Nocardiopsis gilva YIM 90087]
MTHPDIVREIARERMADEERARRHRSAAEQVAHDHRTAPAAPRASFAARLVAWLGHVGAAETWQRHMATDPRR